MKILSWNVAGLRAMLKKGHLEQLLDKNGLDSLKGVIKIGLNGGLSYPLFSESKRVKAVRMETKDMRTRAERYFKEMDTYLNTAADVAGKHNFSVIYLGENNIFSNDAPFVCDTYTAGIGSELIDSPEMVERFVGMIKSSAEELANARRKVESYQKPLAVPA